MRKKAFGDQTPHRSRGGNTALLQTP